MENSSLYILAFDHRESFSREFLGREDHALTARAKQLVFEGLQCAVGKGILPGEAGILVDERYGADVARAARKAGLVLAMPVERSGQRELTLEYDDFASHVEDFEPDFSKVLVRYNPESEPELNKRQLALLGSIGNWLRQDRRGFMVEVLVPPEPAQLAGLGGDRARYDRELRPDLMIRAIREMQEAGVSPELWKIEGLDRREDCVRVAEQVRSGGENARCLVLGRGADEGAVLHWLRQAAGVPGFAGFAVGRTLWWEPLKGWLAGSLSRDAAVEAVAAGYLRMVEAYRCD